MYYTQEAYYINPYGKKIKITYTVFVSPSTLVQTRTDIKQEPQ